MHFAQSEMWSPVTPYRMNRCNPPRASSLIAFTDRHTERIIGTFSEVLRSHCEIGRKNQRGPSRSRPRNLLFEADQLADPGGLRGHWYWSTREGVHQFRVDHFVHDLTRPPPTNRVQLQVAVGLVLCGCHQAGRLDQHGNVGLKPAIDEWMEKNNHPLLRAGRVHFPPFGKTKGELASAVAVRLQLNVGHDFAYGSLGTRAAGIGPAEVSKLLASLEKQEAALQEQMLVP